MFKRSLSQEFPRPMLSSIKRMDRGYINCLQDVYSWRGFSIPNILRTMAIKTRAHLDNASVVVVAFLFYVHGKHLRSCRLT